MTVHNKPLPNTPFRWCVRFLAIMGGGMLSSVALPAANNNPLAAILLGCGLAWLVGEMVIELVEMVRGGLASLRQRALRVPK